MKTDDIVVRVADATDVKYATIITDEMELSANTADPECPNALLKALYKK